MHVVVVVADAVVVVVVVVAVVIVLDQASAVVVMRFAIVAVWRGCSGPPQSSHSRARGLALLPLFALCARRPHVELSEQSFNLADNKTWHPLQGGGGKKKGDKGGDAAASGGGGGAKDSSSDDDDEDEDDDSGDTLNVMKLPSLQTGTLRYDTTGLTRRLAVDLQVCRVCTQVYLSVSIISARLEQGRGVVAGLL